MKKHFCKSAPGRPLVIAHRGASKLHRENTLEAFEAAIDLGADAIEFDVRRCHDGVMVVHHNARVPHSYRRISHLDYSEVLRYAGRQKYHVPTLEETLHLCAGKIALDIELKEPGYESDVVALARRYFPLRQLLFKSFDENCVAALRKTSAQATVGLLIGAGRGASMRAGLKRRSILTRLQQTGADIACLHWNRITAHQTTRLKAGGIPIFAWTVNRKSVARRLIRLGVDGLIGDRPDRLIAFITAAMPEGNKQPD